MISVKRKVNVDDVLYIMVLLYALSTITQSLYPFSLNRLWTVGIVACLLYRLLSRLYTRTIMCMVVIVSCAMTTTIFAADISKNTNDLIYFVTGVLWLLFMSDYANRERLYKSFLEHQRLTKAILVLSYVSMIISLLSGNGYAYQWGSTAYYIGFAGTQHAMASSICIVTALFLLYSLNRKFSWLNLAAFMFSVYAVFETGARTFIIPILILMFYYIRYNIKSMNIKAMVYAVGFVGVLYAVQHSTILDKFSFVSSGGNMATTALEGFTSGRSLFWAVDLSAFASGNVLQIIFGRGFDYVYGLNARMVNQRIWAHNDFIHLLLGGRGNGILPLRLCHT